jgi:hypothetical protein
MHCIYRKAKITPKKIGQFVSLWQRGVNNITEPYDFDKCSDIFIIAVTEGEKKGEFVFPKIILYEKNIISKNNKGGKRGFRLYPPWNMAVSKQAKITQIWQSTYFFMEMQE